MYRLNRILLKNWEKQVTFAEIKNYSKDRN